MSFSFQIAGSGYASNYAHIARKLPKVFSLVRIIGRGSQRSKDLAELSKAPFSNRLIVDLPAVIAVCPDQQLSLLRQSSGPILIEPELHANTIAEIKDSSKIFVANHWASLPAVKDFVAGYIAIFRKHDIRQIEIECSERAFFPIGSILSSLWPTNDIQITLDHLGSSRTNATKLSSLLIDYFSGTVDSNPLTIKVLRRSSEVDDGSDSPQILNIRITTDVGILQLVSPFGPIISNNYLGSTSESDVYLSTSHERISMAQLKELRMKTNYLILDAFRCQVEEEKNEISSPYLMTSKGIWTACQLAALAGRKDV